MILLYSISDEVQGGTYRFRLEKHSNLDISLSLPNYQVIQTIINMIILGDLGYDTILKIA